MNGSAARLLIPLLARCLCILAIVVVTICRPARMQEYTHIFGQEAIKYQVYFSQKRKYMPGIRCLAKLSAWLLVRTSEKPMKV